MYPKAEGDKPQINLNAMPVVCVGSMQVDVLTKIVLTGYYIGQLNVFTTFTTKLKPEI